MSEKPSNWEATQALLEAWEQLFGCANQRELCQRVVEVAGDILKVERCSLLLLKGDRLEGCFGLDLEGRLVREADRIIPVSKLTDLFSAWQKDSKQTWSVKNEPRIVYTEADGSKTLSAGWVVYTLITISGEVYGVLICDSAKTDREFDPEYQHIIDLYCNMAARAFQLLDLEHQLREKEADTRRVFDDSPVPRMVCNLRGEFISCNNSFVTLIGMERIADAMKLNAKSLLDEEAFLTLVSDIEKKQFIPKRELDLKAPSGRVIPVLATLSIRHDAAGDMIGINCQFVDASEWRYLEQAMQEIDAASRHSDFDELLDLLAKHLARAAQVPVVALMVPLRDDPSTVRVIGLYTEFPGLGKDEIPLIGTDCEKVYQHGYYYVSSGANDGHPAKKFYRETGIDSFLGLRLDGDDRSHVGHISLFSVKPMREEGRLLSLMRIFGARALAEMQRRRTMEDMQKQQEELFEAQKMDAMGRLAGGIAHDFNNMLTSIMGMSEILLMDLDPNSTQYEDVEQIRSAAVKASELTKKLLQFGRRQSFEKLSLNANEIVEGLKKIIRPLLGEGIHIEYAFLNDAIPILADRIQLEQALINLIINARDAMPEGGSIAVRTSIQRDDDNIPRAIISIEDTGHGITPEVKKRLFEPFFTTKPKGRGTGLGLPTVYTIMREHGGSIEVESVPGMGSTFSLIFPITNALPEDTPVTSESTISLIGSESILLVEEDEELRRSLRHTLHRFGYRIISARGAGDALLLAENPRTRVDLALIDSAIAHIPSEALVQRIRQHRSNVPVILMTSTLQAEGEHSELPGVYYLQKPFRPDAMLQLIQQAVAGGVRAGT